MTDLVEVVARLLFIRHYVNYDDASPEWAANFWDTQANTEHKGDCPHAEIQGPVSCSRCSCDEFRETARAAIAAAEPEIRRRVLEELAEPTEAMRKAGHHVLATQDQLTDEECALETWRAMLAARKEQP